MKNKDPNRERYNQIWKNTKVQPPEIWSTWKVVREIIGDKNLEIGSGNYPSIPIKNGFFLDISETAIFNLKKIGGRAFLGSVEKLTFPNNYFDCVVALDVLEHVDNDKKALLEISRVLKSGGFFLFSVPLGKEKFSEIDKVAGHKRRYEVKNLIALIKESCFRIIRWRAPSLKYFHLSFITKIPIFGRFLMNNMLKIYKNKSSQSFFGLPKFIVNYLVRFTALIDRITAPSWCKDRDKLEKFTGEGVIVLCQKLN